MIAISETVSDPTTFFIETLTGSRFGHVGIVIVANGQVTIAEADPLLGGTGVEPAETFLGRAEDTKGVFAYTILDANLSPTQTQSLVGAIQALVTAHVPYNRKQVYDRTGKTLNCSEFIFTAFKKIGLPVGEIEPAKVALNINAFNGGVLRLASMVGTITPPQPNDPVITPLSVVKSKSLRPVASTVPLKLVLTDAELDHDWEQSQGYFAMVTTMEARAQHLDPLAYLRDILSSPEKLARYKSTFDMITNTLHANGPLSNRPFRLFPPNWRQD